MRAALRHARLQAERDTVAAAIPPDPSFELAAVERKLAELRRDRTHLLTGRGRYIGTRAGDTARRLILARQESSDAQRHLAGSDSWWDRRHWRKEATRCADVESATETAYTASVGPEMNYLDQAISRLETPGTTSRSPVDNVPHGSMSIPKPPTDSAASTVN